MTAALNDAILLLARCIASASGSAGRPFRVVRFLETRHISASRHGEGCGSRGSHDAGACRAELSRGVPGGKLHSDAAQSPRLGSTIT